MAIVLLFMTCSGPVSLSLIPTNSSVDAIRQFYLLHMQASVVTMMGQLSFSGQQSGRRVARFRKDTELPALLQDSGTLMPLLFGGVLSEAPFAAYQ